MNERQGPPSTLRTPSGLNDMAIQLCVCATTVGEVFPLVGRLPSTISASILLLFDGFSGTMQPSDFPEAYTPDVRQLAFSGRPALPSWTGTFGISRFPCKEFPHMLRVSDCAGPSYDLRLAPWSVLPSASVNSVRAPKKLISQLNGWPVCTPVNASPMSSRTSAHDSGPVWLAGPSPYGSFIHYSLPALTGAFSLFLASRF